jgi:hypothetical protein
LERERYSRSLPSTLDAITPSATWGHAILWWQVPTCLGYIAHLAGFIITNDSEDILTVCIINTTASYLLDIFNFWDHLERLHIMPCTCHCKFYVLRTLKLSIGLRDMYNSCFAIVEYICMLKHQIIIDVNTVFCQRNCLVFLYITTVC